MKINILSGLSGVSSETIRKYRDRDLLRPRCNPENGYYEYSNADFLNLLYIRKLRGANLSLETIGETYSCDGAGALLAGYRETLEALDRAYIAENLSPGGSADLMALCWLLHFLKEEQ